MNGVEALKKLHEHEDIDMVFSDINMPEMDGLTLLEKWKKDVFTSELIILNRALLEARKK